MEKLPPGENVIWSDPGDVASLDFAYGVGGQQGAPQPPFTFIEEDLSGSNAKVFVKDAAGRKWSVKWSKEAHSDVFGSRLAWACGYIAQPEYYVPQGQIVGINTSLKRAGVEIHSDGSFSAARFQLRSDDPKFLKDAGWSWVNSPFRGSSQLHGLKILMMLVSDWDNKDARDEARDSNLAVFQQQGPDGPRYLYFVADWGGSMGKWGNVVSRDKWDAKGFADQTPDFVRGVHHGMVEWGYQGQRTSDQVHDIRSADVLWLMQYLGKVTDDQLRAGLIACGATPQEVESYTSSLRARIVQLRHVAIVAQAQQAVGTK